MTEYGAESDQKLFIFRRLSDEQIQSFRDQGYIYYGSLLTHHGLAQMREEAMEAWNEENRKFDQSQTWLKNSLLTNIHRRSNLIRRYYFHGPFVDVAEQLVGPNLKGVTSQLSFKLRGNTKLAPWHQDNGYGELDPYTAITCITALDDTDLESGCLWIIPGGHRLGQIDVSDQLTVESKDAMVEVSIEVDETSAIPIPMKVGESLIFHGWMPHKSLGNTSDRDRRLLFLRYADADAVEVYNNRKPRLGKLVRGKTRFREVEEYEADLD